MDCKIKKRKETETRSTCVCTQSCVCTFLSLDRSEAIKTCVSVMAVAPQGSVSNMLRLTNGTAVSAYALNFHSPKGNLWRAAKLCGLMIINVTIYASCSWLLLMLLLRRWRSTHYQLDSVNSNKTTAHETAATTANNNKRQVRHVLNMQLLLLPRPRQQPAASSQPHGHDHHSLSVSHWLRDRAAAAIC